MAPSAPSPSTFFTTLHRRSAGSLYNATRARPKTGQPPSRRCVMDTVRSIMNSVESVKISAGSSASGDKHLQPSHKKPEKDEKEKAAGGDKAHRSLELDPPPDFFRHRAAIFDMLMAAYNVEVSKKPHDRIEIALPDGRIEIGTAWQTTPGSVARTISKSLFEKTVVSVVDGELWDLERVLEKSCKVEFLDFEHPTGKKVFWHSSAHILGEAAERRFGCHLCNGPPTEDPPGFYYDMGNMNGTSIQDSDWEPLKTIANQVIQAKQPFERLVVSKTKLLEMFKYNKYKIHFINEKVPDGGSSTVYRCGPLTDLCLGPHIPHTGRVRAFAILKNSASYWLGVPTNESLQRVAGVSFPEKKLMVEHQAYLLDAAKRNHRKIGQDQQLFFFDDVSPGSCFFLPHGARIYNAMQELLKSEYRKRDYEEVITPNMFKADLWKTSGHWDHYEDAMFTFDVEKDRFGLKPMNCPGHCKVFAHRDVSYKNLPMRLAEFGIVHRNELSGALTGLTRVRRFQQDDAHIFCTQEQVEDEINGLFDFFSSIYGLFGFTFKLKLATRPDKYLGDLSTWEEAESTLTAALKTFAAANGAEWELNPGDGAFYGPKIDITMYDALRRDHQCGTIQLDFQLPQRFNLQYVTGEEPVGPQGVIAAEGELSPGCRRPVMIHRAILGSFERMFGVLTEHFSGKWPFWLSPRQILIVPVMSAANDYALEVQKIFKKKMMYVEVDASGNTLQKKIRTGQIEQYNFIFVVGAEEQESRTVNVRNRDVQTTQAKGRLIPLQEVIDKLVALRDERRLINAI